MVAEWVFVASFLGVLWVFSVYLAWQVGRVQERRAEEADRRKRVAALYNAPWLHPGE